MLRICGDIDLFKKKSCGLVERAACRWLCIVGALMGSKEGSAFPDGCSKHAALSCIDCKFRLREGVKLRSSCGGVRVGVLDSTSLTSVDSAPNANSAVAVLVLP